VRYKGKNAAAGLRHRDHIMPDFESEFWKNLCRHLVFRRCDEL